MQRTVQEMEFTTRESQRQGREPARTVWFECVGGRVRVTMSDQGLIELRDQLCAAVKDMVAAHN